jgi:acyl-CoA thioester hydrolase
MNSPTAPTATISRQIEFSDIDSSGRYHYGTVIRLIEAAEVELLAKVGLLDSIYTSMPRARLEVDYSATLYLRDQVEVTVEVADLGRTSVTFEFLIERDGEACARAKLVTVLVDESGRPRPWPAEARTAFGDESGSR